MNSEKIICKCKHVTKGDIMKALEKGASSYKDIKKITGAGSKCGHCESDIKKFIKKHRDDS
jgi:NAD(P)H-nitrite reductase large subunit